MCRWVGKREQVELIVKMTEHCSPLSKQKKPRRQKQKNVGSAPISVPTRSATEFILAAVHAVPIVRVHVAKHAREVDAEPPEMRRLLADALAADELRLPGRLVAVHVGAIPRLRGLATVVRVLAAPVARAALAAGRQRARKHCGALGGARGDGELIGDGRVKALREACVAPLRDVRGVDGDEAIVRQDGGRFRGGLRQS